MSAPASDIRLAIGLKLASVAVFMVMSIVVKAIAAQTPPGQIVFFRSFFAIPVILVWLVWRGELATGLKANRPVSHLWRGLVGTSAMGFGFAGMAFTPLPEATAINYVSPILTVVFAAMFLGEEIQILRLSAVALGMIGVMVMLWPRLSLEAGGDAEKFGALLVLFGACSSALAGIFVRKMVATEKTAAIVFYFSVTASALSLTTLAFGWVWPSPRQALMLASCGILGGIGQIFMTSSYRHGDASLTAAFDYTSLPMAMVAGYFLFGDQPNAFMLAGAGLVILAGLIIIWRERRLGLERAPQRKAMTPQG